MEVARSTYFVVFFGGGGGGGSWNVGSFGLPPLTGGLSGVMGGLVGVTFVSGMALFVGYSRKVLSCSYVSVAFERERYSVSETQGSTAIGLTHSISCFSSRGRAGLLGVCSDHRAIYASSFNLTSQ